MDPLEKATNGQTVTIPFSDLQHRFVAEDDLQVWCDAFGLQFEYLPEIKSYKISKA